MKNLSRNLNADQGFSLVELMISMVITLIILGAAVTAFTGGLRMREYESSRTDALTAAKAALNVMTREISNGGYGLVSGQFGSNGLVYGDCSATRIHFRSNINNSNDTTSDPGEDVTYFYDNSTQSIVRYEANGGGSYSGVINEVSQVQFIYHNYAASGGSTPGSASPETGRVTIRVTVLIGDVNDPSNPRNVTFESDVTFRNSPYGLGQY